MAGEESDLTAARGEDRLMIGKSCLIGAGPTRSLCVCLFVCLFVQYRSHTKVCLVLECDLIVARGKEEEGREGEREREKECVSVCLFVCVRVCVGACCAG